MWEALLVDLRPLVQAGLFVLLAAYALLKCDWPEKAAALIFLGAILLDELHHALFPEGIYDRVNVGHLVIDAIMLLTLIQLAMRANRIYPLWLLAAQLIAAAMHLERGLLATIHPFAYWTLTRLPSYLQLVALCAGIVAYRIRVNRGIRVRPWRTNSRPSSARLRSMSLID
jgi:hypothetical protein